MGSSWKLDGTTLTVQKLLKPFKVDELKFNDHFVRSAKPIGDGRTVKISLEWEVDLQTNVQVALAQLSGAGYLDNAQTVRAQKLDNHVVQVTFEDQLPAGFTTFHLEKWLKYVTIVAGEKIIIIGTASNRRDYVEQALQTLWSTLREYRVVKTPRPPKL